MTEHYLDNSATTALSAAAWQRMQEAAACYGNPSSLHDMGLRAEKLVSEARRSILAALGGHAERSGELVFTSCGTEATALALFGTAYAKSRREADRILTTDSEHPSVENALRRLESDGFEVIRIPTAGGVLDMAALQAALDKKIFLATFMLVNNETGARYDVESAFRAVKAAYPSALTHCDAVQGFLKVPFTPRSLGADLITLSAHKVHGPKGVGALYIANSLLKAKQIRAYLPGGGQEKDLRSGTENVIGIVGFGAAAAALSPVCESRMAEVRALRDRAADALRDLGIQINQPPVCAPHVLHVTLPHIKSETMLHFLSAKGVYVSSGSACSSHSHHPSAALLAYGLSASEADCSLRISFSDQNTDEDVTALIHALSEGVQTLVRIRR